MDYQLSPMSQAYCQYENDDAPVGRDDDPAHHQRRRMICDLEINFANREKETWREVKILSFTNKHCLVAHGAHELLLKVSPPFTYDPRLRLQRHGSISLYGYYNNLEVQWILHLWPNSGH